MRLVVFGDRNWDNPERVETCIIAMWDQFAIYDDEFLVISGGARGADTHARLACEKHGFIFLEFSAQWDKFGRAAGVIRNQQMIDEGRPDQGLAFHKDISKSKGTLDMFRRLQKNNIACSVINY